jgi:capsular polysaccharide biosynthesis protein
METTMSNQDPVLGPMIDLRALIAAIRRSRRVWLVTALLGLLIGATLHQVIPHKYSAVTDLYLAQPAGADPTQAMADDVSLLQTEAVAKQAITTDHLHVSPSVLLSHYTGLAVSDVIMSIKFNGASQKDAVSGDKAIARAFLAVQSRELGLQTNVLVRGLQYQISALNAMIGNLNNSINSLSSASPNEQATDQLTQLVNQRGAAASQVSQLQAQIQQALLNKLSANDVSHVLDPATLVPVSTKRVTVEDALSGLVVGLAVGLAAVIFGSLLSARAPDRSTVAATLGAPVELSLGRYHSLRVMRRSRLSRQLRGPSPALRMIERRLRGHLQSVPGSALAVVAVGTPEPTALAVGALALALSSEGHRVVVVDAADNRLLASILGLNSKPQTMETFQLPAPEGPPVTIIVAPEDPVQMAQKPPPDDADAILVLATLDPAFGAEHLASWVTDAVMILSPRGVNLTQMSVSREMLREAGISLRSVILLESDPQDDSSGALSSVDLRLTSVESPESSEVDR